jgi:signal transduction histidine kinase
MFVDKRYISVKINEPQLKERNEALFILLEISNFLSTSYDLRQVLDGALERVMAHFRFDAGRIYLMDPEGESLTLAVFRGLVSEGLERVKISEGFTGKAARTRSFIAQHISDLDDRRRAELLSSKGLKVIVCVPLVTLGHVVGVMNLAASSVVKLDQAKIDLLVAIGNLIAIAANNLRLYADLNEKVEQLKAQKEAIEFFAYSISHDLKSPAVGIYGLVSRLVKLYCDTLDERGKLYCSQVLKASEQIVKLVDQINAYITAKEAPLSFEQCRIADALEDVRIEISDELGRRGIEWAVPTELPTIVAEKTSLVRILRNLLGNALKHGGDDMREIRIQYQENDQYHILKISDDGVALTKEDSERIFQPFYRQARSKGVEGAGLGLAIVKELAERHGGKVWIEPRDKGATFCVSISKSLQ